MDELEIQGKIYISSKRAAELTGYAKDYIGQLARAGKLGGTRVGRAWYVDREALLEIAGVAQSVTEPSVSLVSANSNVTLLQPEKVNTIPSIQLMVTKGPLIDRWAPVSYLSDDRDLIPSIPVIERKLEEEKTTQILVSPVKPSEILLPRKNSSTRFSDGIVPNRQKVVQELPTRMEVKGKSIGLVLPTFSIAVCFLLCFGIAASLSSQWSLSGGNLSATATLGGTDIRAILSSFLAELFNQGIELIHSFIVSIVASIPDLFNLGLQYLLSLLHLG